MGLTEEEGTFVPQMFSNKPETDPVTEDFEKKLSNLALEEKPAFMMMPSAPPPMPIKSLSMNVIDKPPVKPVPISAE